MRALNFDFPTLGKRECRARDLTPMPPPVVPGIRLVEPVVA